MCLGIPGQILEISDLEQQLAIVDIGGVRRPVNIACIVDEDHPVEACVGDWVLVHVGFAMNRIDPRRGSTHTGYARRNGRGPRSDGHHLRFSIVEIGGALLRECTLR